MFIVGAMIVSVSNAPNYRQDHLNDLHRNETQSYSHCPQYPHPSDMKQSMMLRPSFRHRQSTSSPAFAIIASP